MESGNLTVVPLRKEGAGSQVLEEMDPEMGPQR